MDTATDILRTIYARRQGRLSNIFLDEEFKEFLRSSDEAIVPLHMAYELFWDTIRSNREHFHSWVNSYASEACPICVGAEWDENRDAAWEESKNREYGLNSTELLELELDRTLYNARL